MKRTKTLVITIAAVAALATSTAVFADQIKSSSFIAGAGHFMGGFMKGDPLERLENEKIRLQQRVKDGKMTQEEADKAAAQIDEKIKQLKEFNSLTVEQKKEKLLTDFTASVNEGVKSGKLTQEKADEAIKNFKTKLEQWDGTGNPPMGGRGFMDKGSLEKGFKGGRPGPGFGGMGGPGMGLKGDADPDKMLENQKAFLQERVKEGKMTQEEADKAIAKLEQKVKDIKEFNSLTLEQKKEKLLNEFTASVNERVKAGNLTQEKADQLLSDFKAKLQEWDGTGRMPFPSKGMEGKGGHGRGFGGPRMQQGGTAGQTQQVQ